jgi:class 3 adenylate cyclase/tetratricopeptide (TPR) repeat protein
MTCSVCGRSIPDDARFCPNCGTPVVSSLATEERKVVTVLFADLVDSTGLAQRLDAERNRDMLSLFYDAATEELETLRGHPEKFIGDAVMAVFGLPQVHEDDALRAVRAGLAIRGRAERLSESLALPEPLEVRVGIESGEAATGIGPAGQLLVTGPVVNAAARLQVGAAPGEVVAGPTTRVLTEAAVSYAASRRIQAKGFDDGLEANPVQGLTTRSVRRTIPIVGRGGELALLRESFGRVRAAGTPLLFTMHGEPGVGKSRLADELVAGLDPSVTVLTGRGQFYADSATFSPVAAMVRDLSGIDDGDEPEKALQRLRDVVGRWCGDLDTEHIVDRLALVFGMSEGGRDESAFVQDVQAGFLSLAEGLGAEGPAVLIFEDVHALRPPMLDLIERVTARSGRRTGHLLVLALARQELFDERPSWGSKAVNHVSLRVEPLSAEDSVRLVRQAAGAAIDEREAGEIAARAGGNPFFIVETTGMLLRRDQLPPSVGPALPPTVQAVVAARLDELPSELRELARHVSVFRFDFDEVELALISDVDVDQLRALEEAEILDRDDAGGQTHWRYRHETLRDVAYASLPKRERRRLHEQVAEALIAQGHRSWAADHLELASFASLDLDPTDRRLAERAAEALAGAGERAHRRMENRSAVDYYQRALAMSGPEEGWAIREGRVLAGMGEARYWLGEYPAATAALDQAVAIGERTGDHRTTATALAFLGDIAINADADVDKAEALLDRSLASAEALGNPGVTARVLLFAGWVPWTRDRYPDAEAIWRRALAAADEQGDRWAQVRALTSLSIVRGDQEDFTEATELIERAGQIADDMGDLFSTGVTSVQRGRLKQDLGRFEEAIGCMDRGVEIFRDLGARWELADALAARGIAERDLGRLDEAENDLRQAIRISEELGDRQLPGWTWRAIAAVSEKRGDHAEAAERYRRAEEEAARGPR